MGAYKCVNAYTFCIHLYLIHVSDWDLLRGTPDFNVHSFSGLLKDVLKISAITIDYLESQLEVATYPMIIGEIFDVSHSQMDLVDTEGQPEFHVKRTKEHWFCMDCLKAIVEENLHLWLLQKRRSGVNLFVRYSSYPNCLL